MEISAVKRGRNLYLWFNFANKKISHLQRMKVDIMSFKEINKTTSIGFIHGNVFAIKISLINKKVKAKHQSIIITRAIKSIHLIVRLR